MMRQLTRIGIAFGLVAAMAVSAQAQGRGQGRGMGMRMAGPALLMSPQVQEELGLSEDQIEKVREIGENMRSTMMEKFQDLSDVPQEERQEKMQAIMSEVTSGVETEVKEVLDEKQMTRYKEMSLQALGYEAFTRDDVAEKLMLTDEQKTKLATVRDETQEEIQSAMAEARDSGDREGIMGKFQEVRAKAMEEVEALLTDEQKAAWKEMTGKPFKLEAFGGGGRPQGRQID